MTGARLMPPNLHRPPSGGRALASGPRPFPGWGQALAWGDDLSPGRAKARASGHEICPDRGSALDRGPNLTPDRGDLVPHDTRLSPLVQGVVAGASSAADLGEHLLTWQRRGADAGEGFFHRHEGPRIAARPFRTGERRCGCRRGPWRAAPSRRRSRQDLFALHHRAADLGQTSLHCTNASRGSAKLLMHCERTTQRQRRSVALHNPVAGSRQKLAVGKSGSRLPAKLWRVQNASAAAGERVVYAASSRSRLAEDLDSRFAGMTGVPKAVSSSCSWC